VKERIVVAVVMLCVKRIEDDTRRKTMATGFGFVFLLKLLGLNLSHQIFFLHMAPIHALNGLNGGFFKWRILEPEH
jgi:hypothetical protein